MTPDELAAIVARDRTGSEAAAIRGAATPEDLALVLGQVRDDRRALLVLLRETREALVSIRRKSDPGVMLDGLQPPTDERGERLSSIFLVADAAHSRLVEP